MISVKGTGSGFRGLQDYLFAGKTGHVLDPERVASVHLHNLDGVAPQTAYMWMASTAAQNPRVEKPVLHLSISPPEGHPLSVRQLREVADRLLRDEALGLHEYESMVVVHHDTPGRPHVHIMLNRVHPETFKAWKREFDYNLVNRSLDEIARDLGLPQVPRVYNDVGRDPSSLSKGAYWHAARASKTPFQDLVRERAGGVFQTATSWQELRDGLAEQGLWVEAKGRGMIVTDGHEYLKASRVDREASRSKMEDRFGETLAAYREREGSMEIPDSLSIRPEPPRDLPPLPERADALIDRLEAFQATFTKRNIARAAIGDHQAEELVAAVENSPRLVALGEGRWTTEANLRAEQDLLRQAHASPASASYIADDAVEKLSEERLGFLMVEPTTSEEAFRQIADRLTETAVPHRALALTGQAAQNLQSHTGIPTSTLSAFETQAPPLQAGEVLLVHKAHLVGTSQMAGLLETASEAKARVLLVGDPYGQSPVQAGAPFHALGAQVADQSPLGQNSVPEDELLGSIRVGDWATAVAIWDKQNRLHRPATTPETLEHLVFDFRASAIESPHLRQAIVVPRRQTQHPPPDPPEGGEPGKIRYGADHLNQLVRSERLAAGEIAEPAATIRGRDFAIGERIFFEKNDPHGRDVINRKRGGSERIGIRRGTLGTLTAARGGQLEVALDDGRVVIFDPERYQSIDYGYAITATQAQSTYLDRAFVYGDSALSGGLAHSALYRQGASLYVSGEEIATHKELVKTLGFRHPRDFISEYDPSVGSGLEPLAVTLPPTPETAPGYAPIPVEQQARELLKDVAGKSAVFTRRDLETAASLSRLPAEAHRLALAEPEIIRLPTPKGQAARYTTRAAIAEEIRLFQSSQALLGAKGSPALSPALMASSLAENRHALDEAQIQAVRHLVQDSPLALLSGRAGTGKSRLFREVADLYQLQGYRVLGGALQGTASDNLAQSAGIESHTLASYLKAWRAGRDLLSDQDVLVIDEAGMVGTSQLREVLDHAAAARAKVVLAGDPLQAKPIEAGEPFRALLDELPSANLTEIRRQQSPWQRQAAIDFADGNTEKALAAYTDRNAVEWLPTREASLANLVLQYREDAALHPGGSQLALAYRRADVAALNEQLQAARIADGSVTPSFTQSGSKGGQSFGEGDRIVFLRNEYSERVIETLHAGEDLSTGIRNGAFGTVTLAGPDRFEVQLDTGRQIRFSPRQYESFGLGYASTIHKAQGATVDRVYLVPDALLRQDLAYVALTRQRHDLTIHADLETFQGDRELVARFSGDAGIDLVGSHASLEDLRPQVEDLLLAPAPVPAAEELEPIAIRAGQLLEQIEERQAVFTRSDLARLARTDPEPERLLGEALQDSRLRVLDGSGETALYTTEGAEATERRLLTAAARLTAQENPAQLSTTALASSSLTRTLTVVESPSETTTDALIQALKDEHEAAGFRVRGLSLTSLRAQHLEVRHAIPVQPLAAFQARTQKIQPGDLLVLDQASRVGSRQMADLLETAEGARARVVLVGHPRSLEPAQAGEAFRGLAAQHQATALSQTSESLPTWRQEALEASDSGDYARALALHHDHGRVRFHPTQKDASEHLRADFALSLQENPEEPQAIVTSSRREADALNREIHLARTDSGELGERSVEVGGETFRTGDRVRFARSDLRGDTVSTLSGSTNHQGVRAGSLGRLTHVSGEQVTAALDDGRTVTFGPTEYKDLELGYALTLHQAENASLERTFARADLSHEASRAKALLAHKDLVLYADQETFATTAELAASLGRDRPVDLISHHEPSIAQDAVAAAERAPQAEPPPMAKTEPLPTRHHAEALLAKTSERRAVFTREDLERTADQEGKPRSLAGSAIDRPSVVELWTNAGTTYYALTSYLQAEANLFQHASRLAERRDHALSAASIEASLAENAHQLSPSQQDAARRLVTGSDLSLLSGSPGSGRTRVLQEVTERYQEAGYTVRVAALSSVGTEDLAESLGVEGRTLASHQHALASGRTTLGSRDVLILEEASSIGTEQMGAILRHAEETGAKVIPTGDLDSIRPMDPGDAFRGLVAEHGAAQLSEIHRQVSPWQRAASTDLAEGKTAEAVSAYVDRQRVVFSPDRAETVEALASEYANDYLLHPTERPMAMAFRRADVGALNQAIQQRLHADGRETIALGGARFGEGERISFFRGDPQGTQVQNVDSGETRQGVRRAQTATIETIATDRVVARLDSGRRVQFDPRQYSEIGLGYATTIYGAQGRSTRRTYLLADPMLRRDLVRRAMTRHTQDLRIHADSERFPDKDALVTTFSREPAPDLARDHLALGELQDLASKARENRTLAEEMGKLAPPSPAPKRDLDGMARSMARLEAQEGQLLGSLERAFKDPQQAREAISEAIGRQGLPSTLDQLSNKPERFGALRGRGGPWPNDERKASLQALTSARNEIQGIARELGVQSRAKGPSIPAPGRGKIAKAPKRGARLATRAAFRGRSAAAQAASLASRLRSLPIGGAPAQAAGAAVGAASLTQGSTVNRAVGLSRQGLRLAKEMRTAQSDEVVQKGILRSAKILGTAVVAQTLNTPAFLALTAVSSAYQIARRLRQPEKSRDQEKGLER